MDPNQALWLSKARMHEFQAEAAAERLASEARMASAEQACREASVARRADRFDNPQLRRSLGGRLRALIGRAAPVHTVGSRT
jgi:hypothetical protein